MSTEILYTQKYPRDWKFADADPHDGILGCAHQDAYEFPEKAETAMKLVPIRSRRKKWKQFVAQAIDISATYALDIQIKRCSSYVCAELIFPVGGYIEYAKPLFLLADKYHIITDKDRYEITLTLDYYTHKVYLNGRLIAPEMDHGCRYAFHSRRKKLC